MPGFSPACPWDFLIDLSISSARVDKTAGQRDARSADDKPTEKGDIGDEEKLARPVDRDLFVTAVF
jgi:hypothetical protein